MIQRGAIHRQTFCERKSDTLLWRFDRSHGTSGSHDYITRDVTGINAVTHTHTDKRVHVLSYSQASSHKEYMVRNRLHETDLVAAIIYIDPFELIFGREFRVRAVRRALRAANSRKRYVISINVCGSCERWLFARKTSNEDPVVAYAYLLNRRYSILIFRRDTVLKLAEQLKHIQ